MDYQGFITTVQEKAHVPAEEAERVTCLTLHTLGQRISAGEAEDLAKRLPDKLRSCIDPERQPEKFDLDEFIRRIEGPMGTDHSTAEQAARAVFAALWTAVGRDEFADMRSQLPKDFDPLLDEAVAEAPSAELEQPSSLGALSYDEFLDRAAQRTRLDRTRAQRAAEAVLEVLASRVIAGQVEDLEPLLPRELRPALERGRARGGGGAIPMSFDAFIDRIAKLEDVSRGEATEHARAVFAALREAVGEKEFHDTTQQLPGEYRLLWSRG
jgi:uncharacterized protein (DUF2267 family)